MKISLTLATLTAAASLCAAKNNCTDIDALQRRVEALEQANPCCYHFLKPVYEKDCDEWGVHLTAEPLYWRATEEGLSYAMTGEFSINDDPAFFNLDLTNGKTRHPDFDWHWGFRVGAGYEIPYDGWDFCTSWTRYNHSANDHAFRDGDPTPNDFIGVGGTGEFISPFWIAQVFAPPGLMNQSKALWNLHLNLLDFELGRDFYLSRRLSVRPFVSLRTGWVDQNFNLSFLRYNFTTDPITVQREISVKMKNDFWGIGLRGGIQTHWSLGWGISIYGNAAFSMLDGHFNTKYALHDQLLQELTEGGGQILTVTNPFDDSFENKNHTHTDVAMADLALGLEYETTFRNGEFQFAIWAGYEQNIFYSQNRFMNFQSDFTLVGFSPAQQGSNPFFSTELGNLVTTGFTGGLELGF